MNTFLALFIILLAYQQNAAATDSASNVPALETLRSSDYRRQTNIVLNSLQPLLPLIQQLKAATNANDVEAAVTGLINALSNQGHAVADLAGRLHYYALDIKFTYLADELDTYAAAVSQHGQVLRQFLTVLASNVSKRDITAIEAAVKELQQAGQAVYAARPDVYRAVKTMDIIVQLNVITGATLELDVDLIAATGSVIQTLANKSSSVVSEALKILTPVLTEQIALNDKTASFYE